MHPLNNIIREINSNLESLRDFVDTLDTYLNQKARESFVVHTPVWEVLSLLLEKIAEDKNLILDPTLKELIEKAKDKYPEVLYAKIIDEKKEQFTITFEAFEPSSLNIDQEKLAIAFKEIRRAQERTQMLYSSSLMTLTSSVELFFSKLLHLHFHLHPEAIGTKEKSFSFDDLNKFETIADARIYYITSKIEDVLRGSIADWLSFLRNTLKLSMGYLKDEQPLLEETFQRRNIVVHNGGIANSIYIAKVIKSLCKNVKIGDSLIPDRKYLSERIDIWEKYCILITAEFWKQLAPNDIERAEVLTEITYNHLLAKRWHISKSLSNFILLDKQMPESLITSAQLNYWQCEKHLERWENIRAEVESADYSAKGVIYQLAHLALLERIDEFYTLLPRALQSGELTEKNLREYPIFSDMRSDPRFEIYKEKQPTKKKTRQRKKRVPSENLELPTQSS
ncbi:hypothetical protein [Nostoc sp. FACHB-110]|uniref:hypothetical protein n=1 Tax=Nostoc sp. FACHB-110 TaxID=2692834 RepID=UPI001687C3A1|nr:hypothetical protein [Nostoc sp. FACHB-110]MBD2441303.1 hypothetical protein [Nostoc sp. FACHB-110]